MIYNLPLSVKYLLPNQHLGLVLLNKNHTLCETFWLACSVYVCCAYVKLILLLKHHWIFQAVNYFSLRGTCFIWQYNKNINISANGGKIFCWEPNQYPKIFEDFMRCSKLFILSAFLLKSDIFLYLVMEVWLYNCNNYTILYVYYMLVLFSVFSDPWGKKGNTLSRTVYWWPSPRYDVKLNIVEQFHRYSLWWIWLSHHIDIQESLWNCSTIFKITTDKTNKSIQPQRYHYLKLWI